MVSYQISLFGTVFNLANRDFLFCLYMNPRCTMIRWWKRDGTKIRWCKTRWYDDENVRLLYHRVFTIVPSHFHHRAIAFSPSYHRVSSIAFSLSYYRTFTIVPSRFHHRAIALSPSYHRDFFILFKTVSFSYALCYVTYLCDFKMRKVPLFNIHCNLCLSAHSWITVFDSYNFHENISF
jgi:hypothetical protein